MNKNLLDYYRRSGALWEMGGPTEPHVKTSMSGEHLSAYFNSDVVTAHTDTVDYIATTALLPELKARELEPDWVFTYAPFGMLVVAACTGRLNARHHRPYPPCSSHRAHG